MTLRPTSLRQPSSKPCPQHQPPCIRTLAPTPSHNPEELSRVLERLPSDGPLGLRGRALIVFLAFTAARVGAALKPTHSVIYEEAGVLRSSWRQGRQTPFIPVSAEWVAMNADVPRCAGGRRAAGHRVRHWDRAAGRLTSDPMRYFDCYQWCSSGSGALAWPPSCPRCLGYHLSSSCLRPPLGQSVPVRWTGRSPQARPGHSSSGLFCGARQELPVRQHSQPVWRPSIPPR